MVQPTNVLIFTTCWTQHLTDSTSSNKCNINKYSARVYLSKSSSLTTASSAGGSVMTYLNNPSARGSCFSRCWKYSEYERVSRGSNTVWQDYTNKFWYSEFHHWLNRRKRTITCYHFPTEDALQQTEIHESSKFGSSLETKEWSTKPEQILGSRWNWGGVWTLASRLLTWFYSESKDEFHYMFNCQKHIRDIYNFAWHILNTSFSLFWTFKNSF